MKRFFKAALSVLVIILMLATLLLPTLASSGNDELKVFVASDIHYRPLSSLVPVNEANLLPGDEYYSHANSKGMLTYEADAIIDEFLSRVAASDTKYLLIPGDISEDGFPDEHIGIAQKLRDFEASTGKKVFVIPGNHDIRTSQSKARLDLADFLDIYSDIGYDDALNLHEGSASYTAELDGNYRLLAIDACIYRQDGSTVSDSLYSWIEQQVASAKLDGKKLVGMVHHSLLEHFAIESIGGNLLCLENYKDLASQFADWGIKYVFTGHEHANDISTAVSANGNRVFDIETGSLITYPNAYRHVCFSDESVTIETNYIDKIDTSLLPDGFTEKQLDLIRSDFPEYSFNYFRAGFKSYAYMIPDLTAELAEKMEVSEGTAEYSAISDVVSLLFTAANMPLYDTGTAAADSVEELARKQGFELPKSDYVNVLDVAAVIYAGHYKGNESLENSLELRLFSYGLNAVFSYAFLNLPLTVINSFLRSSGMPEAGFNVVDDIYSAPRLQGYIKGAVNAVLKELLMPIADGIVNDISVPDDLSAVLEPYGAAYEYDGNGTVITASGKFFNVLFKIIKSVLNAALKLLLPWLR